LGNRNTVFLHKKDLNKKNGLVEVEKCPLVEVRSYKETMKKREFTVQAVFYTYFNAFCLRKQQSSNQILPLPLNKN
jgi:hypothetical protein